MGWEASLIPKSGEKKICLKEKEETSGIFAPSRQKSCQWGPGARTNGIITKLFTTPSVGNFHFLNQSHSLTLQKTGGTV